MFVGYRNTSSDKNYSILWEKCSSHCVQVVTKAIVLQNTRQLRKLARIREIVYDRESLHSVGSGRGRTEFRGETNARGKEVGISWQHHCHLRSVFSSAS